MAVRGKPVVTLTNQTTLLHAPVRAHSQKPVEFYDLVEFALPGAALRRPVQPLPAQRAMGLPRRPGADRAVRRDRF
jgi:hypothetical protein